MILQHAIHSILRTKNPGISLTCDLFLFLTNLETFWGIKTRQLDSDRHDIGFPMQTLEDEL